MIMKLWTASIFCSAASTKPRIADGETPCSSGMLRGRPSEVAAAEFDAVAPEIRRDVAMRMRGVIMG